MKLWLSLDACLHRIVLIVKRSTFIDIKCGAGSKTSDREADDMMVLGTGGG